jgi:ubiquinol-cytochrome c reductase cytochrome b subunit
VLRRIARSIDERLGAGAFADDALNKVFPDHWSFMVGEIALYSFVVLVVTGTFLTFFFDPSIAETTYQGSYEPLQGIEVSEAYRSTVDISFDVRAGLVMRQTHHWAAIVFIAAIVVHLLRIFFTGAFRRPREINWIVGITLLLLAILNGFTGYSLPDDLLSGTGLRIAYSIALSVPLIGTWLAFLIFGGEFPAAEIIPRLFVTHVMLVPAAIIGLLTGAQRVECRRLEAVADLRREVRRTLLHHRCRPVRAGRTGPDQPRMAVRALPRPAGDVARTARLVDGVGRRCAAADAGVGDKGLRFRASESLLPRRPPARHHVRVVVRVAVPGGPLHG